MPLLHVLYAKESSHLKDGKDTFEGIPKCNIRQNQPDVETNLALNVNNITLINAELNTNLIVDTFADHFDKTTQFQVYFQIF